VRRRLGDQRGSLQSPLRLGDGVLHPRLGVGPSAGRVQQGEYVGDVAQRESGSRVARGQLRGHGGMRQCVEHRQRLLLAQDVAGRGLAGHGLVAPDAQNVILELERQPQRRAVAPIGVHGRGWRASDQRADLRRGGQQRTGLATDHRQIFVKRHLLAVLEGHVEELAFRQRHAHLIEDP